MVTGIPRTRGRFLREYRRLCGPHWSAPCRCPRRRPTTGAASPDGPSRAAATGTRAASLGRGARRRAGGATSAADRRVSVSVAGIRVRLG
jgi:hypothetical protein